MFNRNNVAGLPVQNNNGREKAVAFININALDKNGRRRRVGYIPLQASDAVQSQVYERLMSMPEEDRAAELSRLFGEVFELDINPTDTGEVIIDF